MDDLAFVEVLGQHFPDFFEAKSVGLRLAVPPQIILLDDLFRQTAVTTFGEESDPGMEFHASFERGFGLAVTAYSQVVCRDTFDGPVVCVDNFAGGKSGVYFHAYLFCSFCEPLAELVQTYDVVAIVVHLWWCGYRY